MTINEREHPPALTALSNEMKEPRVCEVNTMNFTHI